MSATVILPGITPLTRPWWDACREGRLLLPLCNACGKHFFRPEVACTHCISLDWQWVEASGRGTLYSYSVIHRAPLPGFKTPLVFAIVELAEGPTMFSNVIECAPEQVRIGMSLQVVFEPLNAEVSLPKFRPLES
jgi:uncharacterized OB-fold protein